MIELQEYVDEQGKSPFTDWFNRLDSQAALKVATYLKRLEKGNTSSLKSLKDGVYECRIDWGPGYRVYLGQAGKTIIILLGGGTKKRQQQDIEKAKRLWQAYKQQQKE